MCKIRSNFKIFFELKRLKIDICKSSSLQKCLRQLIIRKKGCIIEGLWGLVKLEIKKMKGILPHKLTQILDEFGFRYMYG